MVTQSSENVPLTVRFTLHEVLLLASAVLPNVGLKKQILGAAKSTLWCSTHRCHEFRFHKIMGLANITQQDSYFFYFMEINCSVETKVYFKLNPKNKYLF